MMLYPKQLFAGIDGLRNTLSGIERLRAIAEPGAALTRDIDRFIASLEPMMKVADRVRTIGERLQ
jgi:hypothetical protein